MACVSLNSVALHFPIYSANSRSFRKSLINLTTGGAITAVNDKNVVQALANINIELKDGDRVGLVGHNGAGKSTLLKVIAGIYQPSAGNIHILGKVATLINIALGMDEEATGYENIRIRALILGLKRKEIEKVIPEIEEFCELGNYLSLPVKTYSSGMRLRLAFAISTSINPEILLLDEVIGVGDANFTKKAEERLKHIINKANILVLASHSNEIIREFCNKAILLKHGQIVSQGPVEEVLLQYA